MHSLNVYLQYLRSGKSVSFVVLSQSDSPIDTQKRHLCIYHSAGKRDRDLTPSPYEYARWPEGPRALLSERSEL